jgi:NAD+ synthase (glutamine-hydrolysing)
MKISLAQLNYIIGDFEGNTQKIIAAINKAKAENSSLVVFSELAVCGYPPLDLLEHKYHNRAAELQQYLELR